METAELSLRQSFVVVRDLVRLLRLLQQDAVFCNGMTLTQFIILDHLLENDGELELARLHRLLSVDNSTTTRLIAPLLRQGWLKRLPSAQDSRAACLHVTATGRQVHAEFWQCFLTTLGPLASVLTADENGPGIQRFVDQLQKCCSSTG